MLDIDVGYVNGERVYVFSKKDAQNVAIIKHNDLVNQINKVFRSLGEGRLNRSFYSTELLVKMLDVFWKLPDKYEAWRLPKEIKHVNDINLQRRKDVRGFIKQAKKLAVVKNALNKGGLKVIVGGLQQADNASSKIKFNIINPKYQPWVDERITMH